MAGCGCRFLCFTFLTQLYFTMYGIMAITLTPALQVASVASSERPAPTPAPHPPAANLPCLPCGIIPWVKNAFITTWSGVYGRDESTQSRSVHQFQHGPARCLIVCLSLVTSNGFQHLPKGYIRSNLCPLKLGSVYSATAIPDCRHFLTLTIH